MHRRSKGNGAADAPNLQRRVYEFFDVAAAATECNQTQAHCAREAVIKCNAWRHQCVGTGEGTSSRSLGSQASR